MNKAVLISIRPEWCELIASGRKTIEVRKTRPKLDTPFKCYIYKTMTGYVSRSKENDILVPVTYGKVIGEFVCDDIIVVDCDSVNPFDAQTGQYIDKETCLDRDSHWEYLKGQCGYGWHISDLVIYEQPKELNEFFKYEKDTTIEVLTDDETLCSYCAAYDYGNTKHWSSPISGGGFCEGNACKDAYRSYLKENFAIASPPRSWCYVEELK